MGNEDAVRFVTQGQNRMEGILLLKYFRSF